MQKKAQTRPKIKEHSTLYNKVAASILEITAKEWLFKKVDFSNKKNSGRNKRKNKNVSAKTK